MRNIKKIFASMFVLAVCVSMAAADALWGIRAKKNNSAASEWKQVVAALKQVDMKYPLKANWDAAKVGSYYVVVGSGESKRDLEEAVTKLRKNELLSAYGFSLADLRPTETKEVTVSFKPYELNKKLIGRASVLIPFSVSDAAAPALSKGEFLVDGKPDKLPLKDGKVLRTISGGKHTISVNTQKQTEDNYKKYLWKYSGTMDFQIKSSDYLPEISADEAMKKYNFIFPTFADKPRWSYSEKKFTVYITIPVSKVDDYIKSIKDAPYEYVKIKQNECEAELSDSLSAGYQDGEAELHANVVSIPFYVSRIGNLQFELLGVKSPVYEINPVNYTFPEKAKIDKKKKTATLEIEVTGGDCFVRNSDIKFSKNTCGAKATGTQGGNGKLTVTVSVSKAGEFQIDNSSFPRLSGTKGRVPKTYKFSKSDLGLK